MSHAGTENKFIPSLFPDKTDNIRILEVGHGYGAMGLHIRTKVSYPRGWGELWGLDIWPPYHEIQKKMKIYDHLILGDACNIKAKDKFFNISIAPHVIEHITKSMGIVMLKEMERITKDRIIVTTPNGYTESGPLDENEYNNHLSGWRPQDFEKLGFKTKVLTKNVNSRTLQLFAKIMFAIIGKQWENEVIVAWKDLMPPS